MHLRSHCELATTSITAKQGIFASDELIPNDLQIDTVRYSTLFANCFLGMHVQHTI